MIDPEFRFCAMGGEMWPGGPHVAYVMDFDQRRFISVKASEEAMPDIFEAHKFLARHIDHLSPDVQAITVSDNGDLLSVSSRSEDDVTVAFQYPRYDLSSDIWAATDVLIRSQLMEVDRLGPGVDLMRYEDDSGKSHSLIFKYAMTWQLRNKMWKEIHITKGLSGHELTVPLYSLILDDIQPRILGMTVPFIPGGTFAENRTRTFRFSWLQELTSVADDLNWKFGIMHRDIAPRNLIVDPTSGKIQLFDFDQAVKIGGPDHGQFLHNDVDGVILTIYEILTLDTDFRNMSFEKQDMRKVEDIVDWDVKVPLEEGHGGAEGFRQFLNGWAQGRRAKTIKHYSEASTPLDWPEYPTETPIPYTRYPVSANGESAKPEQHPGGLRRRTDAMKNGQPVVCWERPMTKAGSADGKRKLTSSGEDLRDKQSEVKRAKPVAISE